VQRATDGTIIVSATDLVGYLACDHLAALELGRIEGLWERPPRREDPTVQLLQDRGDAHELAYLERLRARSLSVVEIEKDGLTSPDALRTAQTATLAAMRVGVDVIYQATFFDGRWRGHADFLIRVERPSPLLGSWSYEIADTKLSRGVKAGAILQLCVYADLLTALQGIAPERVHVVTGDLVEHAHRLADYAAYYRLVKSRFETRVLGDSNGVRRELPTYPDPVDHCKVCVWYPRCIQRRRDDDHLSLVAGMRRVDTERFVDGGVRTLAELARLPAGRAVGEMNSRLIDRLRDQARLQLHERETGSRVYELIPPDRADPGRGLAALPEPSPWDVFLDIEADPWATDDGLEYLLGLVVEEDGAASYRPIWGHDPAGEKAAFETLIDYLLARLEAHPELHLYHYGAYEAAAIKRLMTRHETRVDEVDRLLRGEVLVDLFAVVRQGVRASVESYSLKQIEKFYLSAREGPVTEAGFSVVEYERWIRERDDAILEGIAAYNRDDCISTWLLRHWLEERRTEARGLFPDAGWSRPIVQDGDASEGLTAWMAQVAERFERLTAGLPRDPALDRPDEAARRLLADLLDWHRRDEKPAWWLWHELRTSSIERLVESTDAIGGLEYVRDVEARGRSLVRRYSFEPQDHKFKVGNEPLDPTAGEYGEPAGTVVAIDDVKGWIDLLRGPSRLDHHPGALIPPKPIPTGVMQKALLRVADAVIADGIDGDGRYRGARDLLLRRPPRLGSGLNFGDLEAPAETPLEAARRLAVDLDGGVLPIQGPPGTGKTYTGARMIVALARAGRRVGITAQSHKAITNLLAEVDRAAVEGGTTVAMIQKCDTGDDGGHIADVSVTTENVEVERALVNRSVDVAAGTAWLLTRPEFDGALDVLFVEEAGQMSLANAVAMATAARSIVLLGDPNQLPQVSQAVHPPGAGASALGHLVGSDVTVRPDRGLFLDTTYRMHPAVNSYVSEAFYDGRLGADPSTSLQVVARGAGSGLNGAGIRWFPIVHDGNASRSREEAERIADTLEALVGRPWTDQHGLTRPLEAADLIVVAPFNAHVAVIGETVHRRLGFRPRVGTVDKFQGQEGAVAIYSMASSTRDDAPRDMDFLYSRNRLNVAVSRARSIAIVIASPALLEASCRTPDQIRLVNALCRLVEVAADQTSEPGIDLPVGAQGWPARV
jgi:predicted RecB family nuclease